MTFILRTRVNKSLSGSSRSWKSMALVEEGRGWGGRTMLQSQGPRPGPETGYEPISGPPGASGVRQEDAPSHVEDTCGRLE